MEATLGSLFLLTFCIVVSYFENTRFGTYLTPFGAMALPYAVIVAMINLGGRFFGFFPISLISISFVILCMIFFLFGGYLIVLTQKKKDNYLINPKLDEDFQPYFDLYRPIIVAMAVISIIAGFIHFFISINEVGWINIGSEDFAVAYGSGPLAHIQNLGKPAFFFLFADYLWHHKKYILLLLFLIFLTVVIRQVKYHVIILLLGGIYFSYSSGILKINIKKLIVYSLVIYLIFNLSYVIGFSVSGLSHAYSIGVQTFLFNHFFTYLFGGPIAFSEIFEFNSYPLYSFKEVAALPINILKVLTGDKMLVDVVIYDWVNVSYIKEYFHSANVFGMFGMLWIYMGSLATLLYLFFCGATFYSFYLFSYGSKKRIPFQLINVFILSFLTLSFFGFYFNKVNFSEVIFYLLVIPPIYLAIKTFINLSHRKNKLGNLESP